MAIMLKSNFSLISLDLRENQGLTRQYSRYIYKKLLLNMQKYKQKKEEIQTIKEKTLSNGSPSKMSKDMSKDQSSFKV